MKEKSKMILNRYYSFAFVLLYYKDLANTIQCIMSILKLKENYNELAIVVVDNYSCDSAIDTLKKQFRNADNIFYISNKDNLGFARGNNIGITYARNELKSDFVIAINTDTLIVQHDFCAKIVAIYEKEYFDIMGPKVIGYVSGKNQSPIYNDYVQNTRRKIIKDSIKWFLWKIYLGHYAESKKKEIANKKQKINRYRCVCSGCCLVFSPNFFVRWKGFYPGTFLYREESILFYIVNELGGKTLFSEEVVIQHKGGESTSKEFGKDERKRNLRIYSNRLKSLNEERKLKKMNEEQLKNQL